MEILELKNTVKVKGLVTQTARLLRPRDFPDKNTGVHCHFLLQGIFLTQVRNAGLLHCKHILYHLNYKESPKYIYLAMPHGV